MTELECYYDQHESFLVNQANATDTLEYWMSEHLRLSGIYWGFSALALMRRKDQKSACADFEGVDIASPLLDTRMTALSRRGLIDYIISCRDPKTGAFGGSPGHDPQLHQSLSAVQVLIILDALDEVLPTTPSPDDDDAIPSNAPTDPDLPPPGHPSALPLPALDDATWHARCPRIPRNSPRGRLVDYIVRLQRADGSFMADAWGEVDTRFVYCAISMLALLGALDACDVDSATAWMLRCQNWDGGFGVAPGSESHGAQVFCVVGALAITGGLPRVDRDRLAAWLAERQGPDGGLNGRPEKKSDVCYSFWVVTCLRMLGRVSFIDTGALCRFIIKCQDPRDGGFGDRPGNQPDVFHTFFALAGLSLLQWGGLPAGTTGAPADAVTTPLVAIDPHFALPQCVLAKHGIKPRFTYADEQL